MTKVTRLVASVILLCAGCAAFTDFSKASVRQNATSDFAVEIHEDGSYRVQIKGIDWLYSAPTVFRFNNQTYSSQTGGGLVLKTRTREKGRDVLGPWESYIFIYTAGSKDVAVSFRAYEGRSMVLFGQAYIDGGEGCSSGDRDGLISEFPSFRVDGSLADLGYLTYGYIMTGDMGKTLGRWNSKDFKMRSGLNSGPMALFDRGNNAVFMSSFNNFMAASAVYNASSAVYSCGIMGGVDYVPKGFEYHTILYYSGRGVNKAIEGWGEVMRSYYNKKSDHREADYTNNYLSYWSDNGAYYVNYYTADGLIDNLTYEQAILATKDFADRARLPYKSVQYSVWFEQGKGGGIKAWNASDKLFKDGMQFMYEKTQWASTAHNRWWTVDTPYARQNGGPYNWIIEEGCRYTLPMDETFWQDMFRWSRQWGFRCYMQDWLNWQFSGMSATTSTVDVARTWLLQMGKGARQAGITVQYCMAMSRHILQSLEVPVVTQARASDDYQPGKIYDVGSQYQWKIGISSMFAWAVGLAPFKDTFWSTTTQPDNYYKSSEPYPEVQVIVATLSTGPVGPGDMVEHTNRDLLMRCCAADGLILKPSRPAMAVDAQIKQWAFGGEVGPRGEVWTTYSRVSGYTFGVIFATELLNWFSLRPSDTSFGENFPPSRLYERDEFEPPRNFSEEQPLGLTSDCTLPKVCLYYTTPVFYGIGGFYEILLLGERSKYVPMSPERVVDIQVFELDLQVKVKGQPGEVVFFSYALDGRVDDVMCVMSQAGTARVSVTRQTCEGE